MMSFLFFSNTKTSGQAEGSISTSLPYTTYTQREMPNTLLQPVQNHYYQNLWSSSQPNSWENPKRMSDNPSFLNVNAQKRHCADSSLNSTYPPVFIPSSTADPAYSKNH